MRASSGWCGRKAMAPTSSISRRCGAPLTYRNARRAGEIDVTLGTLDEPGRAAPVDHIWMEDAPPWDRPGDGLPRYPRGRDT